MPYPCTPDPRPLDPPSYWADDRDPEPVPYWHFIGALGSEDYAQSEAERDHIASLFVSSGEPFTLHELYA